MSKDRQAQLHVVVPASAARAPSGPGSHLLLIDPTARLHTLRDLLVEAHARNIVHHVLPEPKDVEYMVTLLADSDVLIRMNSARVLGNAAERNRDITLAFGEMERMLLSPGESTEVVREVARTLHIATRNPIACNAAIRILTDALQSSNPDAKRYAVFGLVTYYKNQGDRTALDALVTHHDPAIVLYAMAKLLVDG